MKEKPPSTGPPSHLDRATSATIAAASASVSLLVGMLVSGLPAWVLCLAFVFGALLIVRRQFLCVGGVLVVLVGYKLILAWQMRVAQVGFSATEVLFALSMLAFVASAMRYLELDPAQFRPAVDEAARDRWGGDWQRVGSFKVLLGALSGSLVRLPVALLLALTLLAILPEDALWPNPFRFDPAVLRTVILVWLFVVVFLLPAGMVSMLRWRGLQAGQAGVYLRRVFFDEAGREGKLVERARFRRNQKRNSR